MIVAKHRRTIGKPSEKLQKKFGEDLNDTQRKVLELLWLNTKLSASKLAKLVGVSGRNV